MTQNHKISTIVMGLLAAETHASQRGNAGWTTTRSRIASAQRMCMENGVSSGNRVVGLCARMVENVRVPVWDDAIAPTDGEDIFVRLVSRHRHIIP